MSKSTWGYAWPIVFGSLGALIYWWKGRRIIVGFLWGSIFGPLMILMLLADESTRLICPFCEARINENSTACEKCNRDLPTQVIRVKE
jgi:hypothetical protein